MAQSDMPANRASLVTAICAGLFLITLAVYLPTFKYDFVNYDDGDYVTGNQRVQDGLSWSNVAWAFTTGHASNWHPLTWLSLMLDCQFHGLNAGWLHLTNIVFHAANAVLLFWVLFRMTGGLWPSAFVAALFAWHPAHVESVAWVSERKDVLSAFFWLLTMLAYAKYVEASKIHPPSLGSYGATSPPSLGGYGATRSPKSKVFYVLALLCFVLGLLSKPMLVTLPFVLLLMDYWPLGRGAWGVVRVKKSKSARKVAEESVPYSRLILEKVPFLALAVISSVVTFVVQREGGAVSPLNALPVGARVANAFVSYLRYAGKIFWPQNLAVLYPYPGTWPAGLIAVSGVFVVGVSIGVFFLGRTRPYLAVGWCWFLGTLVPVIGLVQVGVQSMADRYTYIPAIGLFIMVVWGVPELLARWPGRVAALGTGGAAVLAACLVITSAQIRYWQNGETLFRHVVQVTDRNYLAYNNLGFYLYNHKRSAEAMECYQKSVEINPNYEEAQNNLGRALSVLGRNEEGIAHLEIALRLKPSLVPAHNNLGNAYSNEGKLDAAIAEYLVALQIAPDDEDAHNNLGIARAMQGRLDEAVQYLTEAVRLKPSDSGAHSNLGNALAAQHKLDEAAKQYQIALRLDPEDAKARNNLGNVLSEQGKYDQAAENYRQALKLNAENPEANYNLGMVLLRQDKTAEATQYIAEAVRQKPDYAQAKRKLDALNAAQKP